MKNTPEITKRWLWILFGLSAVNFIMGFFSLLNSVFGITSGEANPVGFVEHLMFALMFLAPVLGAATMITIIILFIMFRKKR